MSTHDISITVNSKEHKRAVDSRLHLADFLRQELGLTGTHIG
jgi:aerobic carbon-monoxide dehydrogenase small subunit